MTIENRRAAAYIDLECWREPQDDTVVCGLWTRALCVVKANLTATALSKYPEDTKRQEVIIWGLPLLMRVIEQRENGIKLPILIMSGVFPWDTLEPVVENELSIVVQTWSLLKRIFDASPSL
jgi:alanine racemase